MHRSTFKVSIIGVGKVGATTAYSMCLDKTPTDIVLVARDKDKAMAEKLDLEHALPFLRNINITATDQYSDISGSDLVVVTAGAAQKPGQTRLDVLKENLVLFDNMIPQIYEANPQGTFLVVSNPVDILTFHASKLAPFKFGQIFGSGTLLDTARFRFHLSEIFEVNSRSIHTYVLGEHGDNSFPTLSSAHIGGQLLSSFPKYSEEKVKEAFTKTQQAAYQIINAKGATYYAIATAITSVMNCIYSDSKSILPVSIPLNDNFDQSEMALSLPCVVGRSGVEQVIELPLSDHEKALFSKASEALKAEYQKQKNKLRQDT